MLVPAEALLVSSSLAFYGLHDSIKNFILACFYRKLLKKRRLHSERKPTITGKFIPRNTINDKKLGGTKIGKFGASMLRISYWPKLVISLQYCRVGLLSVQ